MTYYCIIITFYLILLLTYNYTYGIIIIVKGKEIR